MDPLIISVPHSLGKEEAIRRLKNGLSGITSTLPVLHIDEETWSGGSLAFKVRALGQVAAGNVQVSDVNVRVEVVLPRFLQGFRELVQRTVKDRGRSLLTKQ